MNPIIKNLEQDENKISLELIFPASATYFQGHFPQTPILPGFVQTHYAIIFIQKYWGITKNLSNIKRLKFTKIITPDSLVNLVLEKTNNDKISFKYYSGDRIFSSGEFCFGEINV